LPPGMLAMFSLFRAHIVPYCLTIRVTPPAAPLGEWPIRSHLACIESQFLRMIPVTPARKRVPRIQPNKICNH
jgi:hypothetical protein